MPEGMTNEQILAEFEDLFGTGEEPEETDTEIQEDVEDETEVEETETEEYVEDSESEENESDEEDEEEDEEEVEETPKPQLSKQAKQNHAFAEQRARIKQQDEFIKAVGKLVGFDSNAKPEDIIDKVKEALYEKESKEQNISVDLLKRIERAESLIQENDQIKLEKKVSDDFADLIEQYDLSEEDVDEFTNYLIENDKNPMLDSTVDIAAEYLKLHHEDLVQQAVSEALEKEKKRQDKVDEKASSPVGKGADKGETKINSVKELDDLFASIDL